MRLESVVETALILVLPFRIARAAATRGLRRKLMVFPRVLAMLIIAFVLGIGFLLLAARSVFLFRALAAASAVALAVDAWRGRPAFGRSRNLPPGSLALAPLGPWVDPDYFSKQIARHGPVFKLSHFVQPIVCIGDMALARDLMRSHDAQLAVPALPFDRFVRGGFIRYRTPERHRPLSVLFRGAVSSEVVAAAKPEARRLLRQALDRLAARPELPPRTVLGKAVGEIFALLFFGIEPESDRSARFLRAVAVIDHREAWRHRAANVLAGLAAASDIVLEKPGGFFAVAVAADATCLADRGLIENFLYVFVTASADVTGLSTWLLRRLVDNPEWLARLREEKDPVALSHRVVRETLRLSQSEYLMRRAETDLEVGGYRIPRGYLIRVLIREIHRSAAAFPDPMRFDPERFRDPQPASRYSPLGASRIMCPGEDTSTTLGGIFAVELARGYDVAVGADGPEELGPFHWQPSGKFRVRLTPRPAADAPRAEALRTPA